MEIKINKKKKALVTGGTGFVAGWIIKQELIKIIEFSYLFTFSFGAIRQLKLPFAVLIRHFKPVLRGFSP